MLTHHAVSDTVMAADVKAGKVETHQGAELTVRTMGGAKVNAANVLTTYGAASNEVICVIDTVLMPK